MTKNIHMFVGICKTISNTSYKIQIYIHLIRMLTSTYALTYTYKKYKWRKYIFQYNWQKLFSVPSLNLKLKANKIYVCFIIYNIVVELSIYLQYIRYVLSGQVENVNTVFLVKCARHLSKSYNYPFGGISLLCESFVC